MGHQVTVITGVPNVPHGRVYDGYKNRWRQEEEVEGVRVCRVWTFLAANKGTVRRILNYVSFMSTAIIRGLYTKDVDVVIATSPQFFCGWAGIWIRRLKRKPFILEVRDIWPESIVTVGAIRNAFVVRMLECLEKRMYRAARQIVTVGKGYKAKLLERGVSADRISIVSNGVDLDSFAEVEIDETILDQLGIRDKFVCSYIGTIGMASGLDVVLRVARLLKKEGRDDIAFLLVGDGAMHETLKGVVEREELPCVHVLGLQSKEKVRKILAITDACLVHLKKTPLFKTVMPSKIFEAAAMSKPIILGVEGEAGELVSEANAGVCIEPENEVELIETLKNMAADEEMCKTSGKSAYNNIALNFSYDRLADEYLDLINKTACGDEK